MATRFEPFYEIRGTLRADHVTYPRVLFTTLSACPFEVTSDDDSCSLFWTSRRALRPRRDAGDAGGTVAHHCILISTVGGGARAIRTVSGTATTTCSSGRRSPTRR